MKPEEQPLRIPRLSIKSSFLVLASLLLGGIIIPYLLTLLGIGFKTGVMIILPVSLAFSLVYSHYYLETKQGFCKRFIVALVVATVALELMSYVWLVEGFIF
ncbi:hypothetical protein LQF61_02230 [Tetragenococcus koreensis]|uniref:hypothetical protein n=1 Tax=Tetragenococcus koreensis TaxID=290335 RepID=UPI000F4F157D|nr:hypothetical protein [Tetragenococcus koreensis]AYW44801.1 hypothetical protein C7K43_01980 [Tetragenococcus koreensis]MCF1585306.1 hypothetical protein [Tetragenococcus koreensis]MCF1614887.1 hypothetical protein [Tetragenococcus koreensis]MCF1618894.1 hypothetical protein [Tetragenococcus koreensis]MCF1624718.1 hypothetical protein [Tetragenococcus koreensis]